MSGGVLSEYGTYTFAKVAFDGETTGYWYVSDFDTKIGDRVLAPRGTGNIEKPATVLRVEYNVDGRVAPIPIKHTKKLISIIKPQ